MRVDEGMMLALIDAECLTPNGMRGGPSPTRFRPREGRMPEMGASYLFGAFVTSRGVVIYYLLRYLKRDMSFEMGIGA